MGLYVDVGIVLRTHRLGEAGRVIILRTRRNGRIGAVAKGIRRSMSKFGGRLEPTNHVDAQFFRGRGDLDTVTQADSADRFPAVRGCLDRLGKAMAILEAVDQTSVDREADEGRYRMLLGAMRALDERDSPLIVPAFYLKLLAHDGVGPLVEECAGCGSGGPMAAFDYPSGGAMCAGCRKGRPVSGDAAELLRLILGGSLRAALGEPPSAAAAEVAGLAAEAMEYYLERRLKAVGAYSV